jgi:excisionase family DNA binding protein
MYLMTLKAKEDYPLILTAGHISEILSVSKPTAYELMEQSSFPLIRIGRSKRVLKNEFFNWLANQQTNSL